MAELKETVFDPYMKNRELTSTVRAIKQAPNLCWAASVSWWSRAAGGDRPTLPADAIYVQYKDKAEKDMRINIDPLAAILSEPKWKANVEMVKPQEVDDFHPVPVPAAISKRQLDERLKSGPVLFGYYHLSTRAQGAHAIVIIAPDSKTKGSYSVMDPESGTFVARTYEKLAQVGTRPMLIAWPR